jgi:glycosyltransferase involved in cell wall biosynthesis
MLSCKPVITCTDSGGPLEFINDEQTGFIAAPEPESVAEKIETLYAYRKKAAEMGRTGRENYEGKKIAWRHITSLLAE